MKSIRVAALAAIMMGASVAVAGSAVADSLSGTYTVDVISRDGTPSPMTDSPWVFSPCGPGCTRGGDREFHLQGDTWVSSADPEGDGIVCTTTINANTLAGTTGCGFMKFPLQLAKAG